MSTHPKDRIEIVRQERRSLAMKATPAGIQVLIPRHLNADDPQVVAFIEQGLERLPEPQPVPESEWLSPQDVRQMVAAWAARLQVEMPEVYLREMRRKWASISGAGRLTLARDVLRLPQALADYVICHELLHLRIPAHNKGFHAMLSAHIPDRAERELRLAAAVLISQNADQGYAARALATER